MQSALLILVVMIPIITIITLIAGLVFHYLIALRRRWKYPKASSILISFIVMAFLYAFVLIYYVNATSNTFNVGSYVLLFILFASIVLMGIANFALMRSIEKVSDVEDKNS